MVAKLMRLVAGAAGLALVIAGCGSAPEEGGGGAAGASDFSACMVTDTGGIDDRSFNAASWAGMQAASKSTGAKVQYVASSSENDYVPNINRLISQKCDLVVAVGGLMAEATGQAAKANPNQKFAIVDSVSVPPNVYGMEFNTAQSSFQAGYLAAAMSKSGKVATFGGLPIQPVTIFMDGFYEGVQYYNKQKNKKVEVLGWNEANPKSGSMANSFTDQGAGKRIASNFIQQGADIIFPVAGGTGLGAAAAAKESGGKVSVIWVDTDGCESASQYCDVFLTSVTKGIASAVQTTVETAAKGQQLTGSYLGTLQNGGTGLAPFHQFDSKVPAELKAELEQIKQDIIAGKIKITSPNQPKSS
ncbi:BMP family lipoprotein [Thermomonospora cellulosilytica]|uniref:BMP family lipoprotein n=1 Tax=Thermomonospora cellulosilytica TaxID=1411118 RepID=UPI001C72734A|nr:BMP family ABC transporter substrate-binding protein [Thermomonospora cellulosilytica]